MRLANTSKGKAISMANEDKKASVSDGTRLLPMIQKPSRPMPRSASTACKVITKTFTLFPFYMSQSTLTSYNDGLHSQTGAYSCCTISQIVSSGSTSRFLLCGASVSAVWRLRFHSVAPPFLLCGASLSTLQAPPFLLCGASLSALQAPLSLLYRRLSPLCTLRSLQQCGTEQDTSPATERWSDGAAGPQSNRVTEW